LRRRFDRGFKPCRGFDLEESGTGLNSRESGREEREADPRRVEGFAAFLNLDSASTMK
jgi:hypothetical protein